MIKYFVCYRYRAAIDDDFVKKFYKEELNNKRSPFKLHNTYESAQKEFKAGFYDDSDYHVYSVKNKIIFKKEKSR